MMEQISELSRKNNAWEMFHITKRGIKELVRKQIHDYLNFSPLNMDLLGKQIENTV